MRTYLSIAGTFLTLFAVVAVPAVQAQALIERWPREEYRVNGSGVSLDEAVQMALQMAPDRLKVQVVKAETVRKGDRRVHQIRLLNDSEGKVWTVRIDAETGQMY